MAKTKLHTRYTDKAGNVVPSVTTIIGGQLGWNKGALISWAKKMAIAGEDPDKVKNKAADIGTIAHYMIECYLKDEQSELDDYANADIAKATNAFFAFKKWWQDKELQLHQSELPVVSEKYKYGGTVDLLARDANEVIHLVDFKTSNGIYPEHIVQVAAYKNAIEEMTGAGSDLAFVHILQLSKDSDAFHEHSVSKKQLLAGFKVFKHCLALNKLQKEFK